MNQYASRLAVYLFVEACPKWVKLMPKVKVISRKLKRKVLPVKKYRYSYNTGNKVCNLLDLFKPANYWLRYAYPGNAMCVVETNKLSTGLNFSLLAFLASHGNQCNCDMYLKND